MWIEDGGVVVRTILELRLASIWALAIAIMIGRWRYEFQWLSCFEFRSLQLATRCPLAAMWIAHSAFGGNECPSEVSQSSTRWISVIKYYHFQACHWNGSTYIIFDEVSSFIHNGGVSWPCMCGPARHKGRRRWKQTRINFLPKSRVYRHGMPPNCWCALIYYIMKSEMLIWINCPSTYWLKARPKWVREMEAWGRKETRKMYMCLFLWGDRISRQSKRLRENDF